MLRDPVELLARNVVVDLRGTLAVRAVGAAQIRRVRNPRGTIFPGSAAEATSLGAWAIKLAGTALGAVAEATALSVALAARTVAERLAVTVTKGLAVTVAKGLAVAITLTARTITKRLTIAITKTRARIPITTRTITKTTALTVASWLTIPITKRLTVTITLTARTITKRLTIAKTRARIPITTRTITKTTALTVASWLTIPITKRLTIPITASSAVTVVPRTESSRLAPGIVIRAERTAVATATAEVAAVAAVVLSHDGFLLL
ncbi:hypothetical protein AB4Z38_19210 [Arthrobacter sp. 2RAF6]|uniref:hypothetical protein n=1 Tax=Arthrobacter sp. 2RAF6 TaxID=3233002 RepID=UPI003F8ED301